MIPSTSRRSPVYTGTGAVSAYAFAFKVFADADVQVLTTSAAGAESTLVLTTDYTVTRNADQDSFPGGTVNLTLPLASGARLVVVGNTDYTQTAQLPNGGTFNARVVEQALDRAAMQAQQLLELSTRTLRLPSAETGPITLPALAQRLSAFLAFDAAGAPIAAAGVPSTPVSSFVATLLDDTTAAAARATLGITSRTGTRGLLGAPNSLVPLTKYDLSAEEVVLRSSTGELVLRTNTGTVTCDLGAAGPVANGRDQAGAFAANSWIYLYLIWNGATLATLASTTAPAAFTGATLPAGYTHWAFATTVRWNASSNIIPAATRGSSVMYDIDSNTTARVLSGGTATSWTAVSCATLVPPIALRAIMEFILSASLASAGSITGSVRPTGSAKLGFSGASSQVQVNGQTAVDVNQFQMALNSSQQFDYQLSTAPSTGGFYADVYGYIVPNGDS
jgi:hypothetical protein